MKKPTWFLSIFGTLLLLILVGPIIVRSSAKIYDYNLDAQIVYMNIKSIYFSGMGFHDSSGNSQIPSNNITFDRFKNNIIEYHKNHPSHDYYPLLIKKDGAIDRQSRQLILCTKNKYPNNNADVYILFFSDCYVEYSKDLNIEANDFVEFNIPKHIPTQYTYSSKNHVYTISSSPHPSTNTQP